MAIAREANKEQEMRWNGHAGQAWVEIQELLDSLFKPFEDLLVKAVAKRAAGSVLDVGCGTGGTTLAIARQLGSTAHCTGVDISEPMIALARDRAVQAALPTRFVRADAQMYEFEAASFDMIVSRFGVMFFDDFVQAFANLRRAAKGGGELTFIAWRSAAENQFMTTTECAAAPLLPNLPARRADEPGQFAFADRHRISTILMESGWDEIDIQAIDVACNLPERELTRYVTLLGPVGLILQKMDDLSRKNVIETIRAAFDPYVHGTEVRFTAACWMVRARASTDSRHKRHVIK